MSRSILDDAFAHHTWATRRLIDYCLGLSPEQLQATVPGTYGSILDTLRHVVGGDAFDLFVVTGDRTPLIDEKQLGLPELAAAMEWNGARWARLLEDDLDPDVPLHEVDEDDGYERDATLGLRLAQTLHHGTDHRSQVCTTLAVLGVEPPRIDAFDFGLHTGRVVEVLPGS